MGDKRSGKRAIRGTGSVFHEKSRDRWRGKVTIDGEVLTVYSRTKTGARAKLNELIKAGGKPAPAQEPTITVAEVLAAFLDRAIPSRERQPAPSTIELHRWAQKIITNRIGNKKAETLRVRDIDDMLDALAADGMSRSSMLRIRGTLSQALDYARKREDISRNAAKDATIPAQAPRTKERIALTPDQARTMIEVLRGERSGLMFALSLLLGLRPGEAAALHWGDVGADAVNITRGIRKTGGRVEIADELKTAAAKRTIGITPHLADWFAQHRKTQATERIAATSWADERLVFASPTGHVTDPSNNRRQLKAICDRIEAARAEADPDGDPFPTIKPNELRHSCASLLSDEGVPNELIADLLGHTTTRMVDETYRHRLHPVVSVAATATWTAV